MSLQPTAAAFDEISPWVETPRDLQPPLAQELRCDVVVIGAGYTGLSAALSLREQGADVVVLERDFAGAGASGRNAGHLTPTIGKDIPTLLRLYGRERASALVRFADEAVGHAESLIAKYAIDCDYDACGNVLAAVLPAHEARLRRAADAAAAIGAQVRFLDGAAMRARGLPASFACGVLEERGGTLHPGRYAMGLRRAAIAAGVRLFEGSGVVAFTTGAKPGARTAQGSVQADAAVVATNAYTPMLGWMPRRVAPLRVSLFESAPLSPAQLEAVGWPGREGIYTSHEMLESYHLTRARTVVGGAKHVRHAWGRRLPPAHDPAAFERIERAFRERFPELEGVGMRRFWGGWIALTLDFLPALDVAGSAGNVVAGLGYCGHGVAQASAMGAMLAERVQGRCHEWERALTRRRLQWPPEPLRWVGGSALRAALFAIDWNTDRRIRAAQRRGAARR